MTWYRAGSGEPPVQFTKTKIVDNSSLSDTLAFSEDYHNYDLLLFKSTCSGDNNIIDILTTPDIIDEIFDKSVSGSTHVMMFNENGTNHYVVYRYVSNTEWVRQSQRSLDCIEVYGITCNKTINKTTIYQKGSIGLSTITITSSTNLFDYDLIFCSCCDSAYDDTLPCENTANLTNISGIFDSINVSWNKYNTNNVPVRITEYNISAGNYFMVQGVKFT